MKFDELAAATAFSVDDANKSHPEIFLPADAYLFILPLEKDKGLLPSFSSEK